MKNELIKSWDEMEDHIEGNHGWTAYIFCEKHLETGKKAFNTFGTPGIEGKEYSRT